MLFSRVQTIAIRLSRFIRLKKAKRGRLISSNTLTLAYPTRFSKLFFFSISIFETRLLKRTIIGRLPLCALGSLCAIEISCSSTLTYFVRKFNNFVDSLRVRFRFLIILNNLRQSNNLDVITPVITFQ